MQDDFEIDHEPRGHSGRPAAIWERFLRSGTLTPIALLLLFGGITTMYMAHKQGRIHQLTTSTERDSVVRTAHPGGQDVLHLLRSTRIGAVTPEFSSATLLPGDGMLLLQTTLSLPGRGDVPLLQATPETGLAAVGANVSGATFSVTAQTRTGSVWSAPVEMLAGRPSSQVDNDIVPDGSRSVAHFAVSTRPAADAPRDVDVTVESALTGRGLDLLISAHNSSNSARWLTLAWQPRFLAPLAGLSALAVVPPAGLEASDAEIPLGTRNVDETYTNLKRSFLSTGPEVRLRNHADGYTLRLTALTPSIRSLHVQAAKDGKSVLLAFSTAGKDGAEAHTLVAPGQTLQWRVRVEALAEPTQGYASSAQ